MTSAQNSTGDARTRVTRGGIARPGSAVLALALVVFALAFVVRALALLDLQDVPALLEPTNDGARYHEQAAALAGGEWPFAGAFYQSPAYPFFTAALYKLFGTHPPVALRTQIVLGALSAFFLFLATSRLFGPTAGVLAGLLYALYGPAIQWDLGYQKTSLAQFLQCLALWLLVRVAAREPRPNAARGARPSAIAGALGLGLALGVMSITRETLLPIALAIPVVLYWRAAGGRAKRDRRAAANRDRRTPALIALGIALALAPTTIYNATRGGGLAVTTVQAGPNFYIGNHRGASGTYEELRPGRQDPRFEGADARAIAEEETGRVMTAAEVSRFWVSEAMREMSAAPGEAVALFARKVRLAWNEYEVPDIWGLAIYRESSFALRVLAPVHFGLLAPLALAGFLALRGTAGGAGTTSRGTQRFGPATWLALAAVGITLFVAIFYIFGRYRAPLVPVLVPAAACGAAAIGSALRRRDWSTLAPLAGVLAIAFVFVNVPVFDEPVEESVSFVNAALYHMDREEWEPAEKYLRSALARDPASASGYRELGRALVARGEYQAGADALDRATLLAPGWVNPHIDKGELLLRFERYDEALEVYRQADRLLPGNAFIRGRIAEIERSLAGGGAPSD